jgi:dolichol-phosphate mannosyltransferase
MKAGISIIIPVRNEDRVILKTLQEIEKYLKIPYEIIVINDCSNDNTEVIVKNFARNKEDIKIIRTRQDKKGFSNALKKGFEAAKAPFVIPVMADFCDDPRTINRMYEKTDKDWDIICGSRYMKRGKKIGGPKLQGFLSKMVCKSLHLITGIPTTDVSNAFKMYRKEAIKNIVFNPKSGVEASMEITFQAFFNGAKITEVPTTWRGRKKGISKFKMIERSPRYFKIYLWAVENALRKKLGVPFKKFYS